MSECIWEKLSSISALSEAEIQEHKARRISREMGVERSRNVCAISLIASSGNKGAQVGAYTSKVRGAVCQDRQTLIQKRDSKIYHHPGALSTSSFLHVNASAIGFFPL